MDRENYSLKIFGILIQKLEVSLFKIREEIEYLSSLKSEYDISMYLYYKFREHSILNQINILKGGTELIKPNFNFDPKFSSIVTNPKSFCDSMIYATKIYYKLIKEPSLKLSKEEEEFILNDSNGFGIDDYERLNQLKIFVNLRKKYEMNNITEVDIENIFRELGSNIAYIIEFIDIKFHPVIANKLIEAGLGVSVINVINKLEGVSDKSVSEMIYENSIKTGRFDSIIENMNFFQNIESNLLATKIIDGGHSKYLIPMLKDMNNLDFSIALKLIENKEGVGVVINLNKFKITDYNILANKLIDEGVTWTLIENIEKFKDLNNYVANRLISTGLISKEQILKLNNVFNELDSLT